MYYAQNKEDKIFADYFGEFKGTLLEIGANDGKTLSNSLHLIELGWSALLVEPSPNAFDRLKQLHQDNPRVKLENCAITEDIGDFTFYETGAHLTDEDTSLLSTMSLEELERFGDVEVQEIKVAGINFKQLCTLTGLHHFDLISIDAEGQDLNILKQIPLKQVGCKLLCIEWNSKEKHLYHEVVLPQGFTLLHKNAENLIYQKQ